MDEQTYHAGKRGKMTENKRIIKFRGRRRDNGEWMYGLLIYGYNDFCAIRGWMSVSGGQEYATVEVIGKTVGEFTGLLDKNGKEIYEGDIVKHNDNHFVMKWSENRFGWVGRVSEEDMNWRDGEWFHKLKKHIEVIGNLYENPELIKS